MVKLIIQTGVPTIRSLVDLKHLKVVKEAAFSTHVQNLETLFSIEGVAIQTKMPRKIRFHIGGI